MSIRPGARIASCKSTMRQFAGISLFARVPSLRITPSSISSRGWSIRSIGVSNVAAVSAIMKNLGVQRTERSFYRKSSISLLKHRGRNQSAEPERRTSTSHDGLNNANVIITTECVVTARFSTVCRGCSFLSSDVGEWLSLVEHLVRDQGVGGSNPLSPTNYPKRVHWISDVPKSWISSIWVLLGPISKPSTFSTASLAPAGSECKYTLRVISEEECPRRACTVPRGVFTESRRLAFAWRSECQLILSS